MDADTEFLLLYTESAGWREALKRREGRGIDDPDAEILASMFEQFLDGVTDGRALYIAASRRLARVRYAQERFRRPFPCERGVVDGDDLVGVSEDHADAVVKQVDAAAAVGQLTIREIAKPWVEHCVTGQEVSHAEFVAGRRWAQRAARRLGCLGHAA